MNVSRISSLNQYFVGSRQQFNICPPIDHHDFELDLFESVCPTGPHYENEDVLSSMMMRLMMTLMVRTALHPSFEIIGKVCDHARAHKGTIDN